MVAFYRLKASIAFVLFLGLAACSRPDEYSATLQKPLLQDLIGVWLPTDVTQQEIRSSSKYPDVKCMIVLRGDGSFSLRNVPDWWNPLGFAHGGFLSFDGKWKFGTEGKGLSGDFWALLLERRSSLQFVTLSGQKSPYVIRLDVGESRHMDFARSAIAIDAWSEPDRGHKDVIDFGGYYLGCENCELKSGDVPPLGSPHEDGIHGTYRGQRFQFGDAEVVIRAGEISKIDALPQTTGGMAFVNETRGHYRAELSVDKANGAWVGRAWLRDVQEHDFVVLKGAYTDRDLYFYVKGADLDVVVRTLRILLSEGDVTFESGAPQPIRRTEMAPTIEKFLSGVSREQAPRG